MMGNYQACKAYKRNAHSNSSVFTSIHIRKIPYEEFDPFLPDVYDVQPIRIPCSSHAFYRAMFCKTKRRRRCVILNFLTRIQFNVHAVSLFNSNLFAFNANSLKKMFLSPRRESNPQAFWSPVRRILSNHWATRTQMRERRLRCVLVRTCDITFC